MSQNPPFIQWITDYFSKLSDNLDVEVLSEYVSGVLEAFTSPDVDLRSEVETLLSAYLLNEEDSALFNCVDNSAWSGFVYPLQDLLSFQFASLFNWSLMGEKIPDIWNLRTPCVRHGMMSQADLDELMVRSTSFELMDNQLEFAHVHLRDVQSAAAYHRGSMLLTTGNYDLGLMASF
ncbi:unnamed protein product [Echinostoma caproni]|uniref:COMM domain-containing protein n=1 Tax=Echinostoma caproni TaxID=27848 RepID=A0A183B6B1_9TREM|nr:unnamed protein product [Echinostoma caproni]